MLAVNTRLPTPQQQALCHLPCLPRFKQYRVGSNQALSQRIQRL
jgi:hypothetical protein